MPPAKKAKNDGEEKKGKGKGHNKYGSKGTIRCLKCQKNKWKCKFDNPEDPCDYCAARGLVCGRKLMTPRKEAEKAAKLQTSHGLQAAFQLSNAFAMTNQLQINTNVPLNSHNAGNFNLSSAHSEYNPNPLASSASSSPPAGGHATYPAFASVMSTISLGQISQPPAPSPSSYWSFQPREMFIDAASLSPDTASVTAGSITEPSEPVSPPAPHRRPAHALAQSALPIVSGTGIPHFPRPEPFNPEEEWQIAKKIWLDKESLVARFARTNMLPSSKRGRRTAGKWPHLEGEEQERKGIRNSIHLSTKSAPTVVSL